VKTKMYTEEIHDKVFDLLQVVIKALPVDLSDEAEDELWDGFEEIICSLVDDQGYRNYN